MNINDTENLPMEERKSWKEMSERLYRDVCDLYEKESKLIRLEIQEKLKETKHSLASLITGGVMLLVGVLCVAATAIIGLNYVTELWIAATVVTGVFLIVGFAMFKGAQKKMEMDNLKPTRSIEAMREMKTTLKERFHDYKHQHA